MSKTGDLFKKVEDEIEQIFTGTHGEHEKHEKHQGAEAAVQKESSPDLSVEMKNLAFPEIHTGKVDPYEKEAKHAHPAEAADDSPKESGKTSQDVKKDKKKVSVQYDMLAVPEIHISKESQ